VPERVSTVLFVFPDSREVRHMAEPPRVGSRVRSPRGAVWTVAQVVDYGSDTYTAACVGASRMDEAEKRRNPDRDDEDLAAGLLQRVKDSLSPRAIRRRWRHRNYIP
jgi:hypothetical protein